MKNPHPLTFLILLLLSSACSNNLPDYVKLGDLRVLTLKADTPEVDDTGATVQITPYISDLNGGGRSLSYTYQTCPDPGIGYGSTPSCSTSSSNPATFSAIGTSRKTYTGAAPPLSITIPTGFLASSLQPLIPNQFNGVAYLVIYTLSSLDGTSSVTAFKRLIVSTNPSKNSNPTLSQVLADGSSLAILPSTASYPSSDTLLSAVPSAGSTETYSLKRNNGSTASLTESLTTTWFYSDGSLENFRTIDSGSNKWTPPNSPPTDHSAVFVLILNDGRGGIDVKQIEFQ